MDSLPGPQRLPPSSLLANLWPRQAQHGPKLAQRPKRLLQGQWRLLQRMPGQIWGPEGPPKAAQALTALSSLSFHDLVFTIKHNPRGAKSVKIGHFWGLSHFGHQAGPPQGPAHHFFYSKNAQKGTFWGRDPLIPLS